MSFSLDLKLAASLIAKGSPERMKITASETVRSELAERFGYLGVSSLKGQIEVRLLSAACWQLKGVFMAEITQACVVSGEAVAEDFQFELLERYLAAPENSNAEITEEIDPMGVDVEMLENGMIPVGEAVAQALALHAAPWPRHPDAPILAPPEEAKEENRPFAKLSELKK